MRLPKDPNALLEYGVDWSDWLAPGERIATSTWFVEGADEELVTGTGDYASSHSESATKVWLSGGTVGRIYSVTNRITTDGSPVRTDDRTLRIAIVQR